MLLRRFRVRSGEASIAGEEEAGIGIGGFIEQGWILGKRVDPEWFGLRWVGFGIRWRSADYLGEDDSRF